MFYVGFWVLLKLFFSFPTQSSRLCPYLYYTCPKAISHHSQLLSSAFYALFSLFIITHSFSEQIRFCSLSIYLSISITLLTFHHHPPPTVRTLFIFVPSILKDFLVLYPFPARISVTFCRQNVTDGPVRLRQDGSASVFSPTTLHYCFNNTCFYFSRHALKVQFISWCSKHNKKEMLNINFGRSWKVTKYRSLCHDGTARILRFPS